MEIQHTYFYINDMPYFDYKLIWDKNPRWACHISSKYIAIDTIVEQQAKFPYSYCSNFDIRKNATIYVAPQKQYALEDIRKNYTIKRDADSGDFNVFPTRSEIPYSHYITANSLVIVPSKKTIIVSDSLVARDVCINAFGNEPTDAQYHTRLCKKFIITSLSESYCKLVMHKLKKPCVVLKKLDMTSDYPVTLDALKLVYETGKTDFFEKDAVENFITQCSTLNNLNWRGCPGTVSFLFDELFASVPDGAYKYLRYKKTYPKTLYAIINDHKAEFKDKADYDLCMSLVQSIINVGDCKFVDMLTYRQKIQSIMSLDAFNKLFKSIIKITPREYEDSKS